MSSKARILLGVAILAAPTLSAADPPVIPDPPPPVFCFAKTGAEAINGGEGIRIQFQILNWTDEAAGGLRVTANTNPAVSTAVDGAGNLFGATTPEPLFGPFAGKVNNNDWSVSGASTTVVEWAAGTPLQPLDPLGPLPVPLDSGINTLDGFLLDLPDLGVYERAVFGWELLDEFGGPITDDPLNFRFGTFQIDRAMDAPDGRIRQVDFVWAGIGPGAAQPLSLDIELTEQNARPEPPPGQVPLPLPAALLATALLGLAAVRGRIARAA